MITILHTESSLGWGGQERRIMRELLGLSRESFRPVLACRPESRIAEKAREDNLECELVKMRGNFDPLAVAQFLRIYRRYAVDLVHTHSSADSWMASVAAKLSPRRPQVVRTRHLSSAIKTRLIYSHLAHRVVTVGESTRRYLVQEKGIPQERVLTIPTGVDLTVFDPLKIRANLRNELGLSAETPVIGTMAVFRRSKGHRFLLQAMPQILQTHPDLKLLLAGEGPQEQNLRKMIEELGIAEAVLMPGFREDGARVLNTLDVFVFPSLEEALGTAILEALAMEKPVVATRVGGIPEIVEDGRTGFLVPPEDPKALADKVIHLLRDRALGKEMGLRGRRFVESHHDNRFMIRGLENLYRELMEKRKSPKNTKTVF